MNRQVKFIFLLSLQVILLFIVGMFGTFLSEYLQQIGFFADVYLKEPVFNEFSGSSHWEWGARHYWYFWMVVVLFILQIIRIVMFVDSYKWTDK